MRFTAPAVQLGIVQYFTVMLKLSYRQRVRFDMKPLYAVLNKQFKKLLSCIGEQYHCAVFSLLLRVGGTLSLQ